MSPAPIERRVVIYRGRVQGVGFRYTAQRIAADFPLVGYVQNLPDGTVRIEAEAPTDVLDRFFGEVELAMRRYITNVTITTPPATGEHTRFEIRP